MSPRQIWLFGIAHERANVFAFDYAANIPKILEIKDQYRNVSLLAHGQGGHVHHAELFSQSPQ